MDDYASIQKDILTQITALGTIMRVLAKPVVRAGSSPQALETVKVESSPQSVKKADSTVKVEKPKVFRRPRLGGD